MKKTRMDIQGKTFGRLTVLGYSHNNKHGQSMWRCRCECGKEIVAAGLHLKSGHTKSCGCFRDDALDKTRTKHGLKKTRLYRIWSCMKARCFIEKSTNYHNYGGRGITVCDEWRHDFQAFYDWAVANGYSDELSIDRIDVNGNYEPSNCRWATAKEQNQNTRRSVKKCSTQTILSETI